MQALAAYIRAVIAAVGKPVAAVGKPVADIESVRDAIAEVQRDPYTLDLADPERQSICHTVESALHGTFTVHGPLTFSGAHLGPCPLAEADTSADGRGQERG